MLKQLVDQRPTSVSMIERFLKLEKKKLEGEEKQKESMKVDEARVDAYFCIATLQAHRLY